MSFQTFKFSGTRVASGAYRMVDATEHEQVDGPLSNFTTKQSAVEYLLRRNWSVKDIGQKIRYSESNKPMLDQHINQIRQKLEAKTGEKFRGNRS